MLPTVGRATPSKRCATVRTDMTVIRVTETRTMVLLSGSFGGWQPNPLLSP